MTTPTTKEDPHTLTDESVPQSLEKRPLRLWVQQSVEDYFAHLGEQAPSQVYPLVRKEFEIGLLKTVMKFAKGNQSKAAQWLGLARGTLRKKLQLYGLE